MNRGFAFHGAVLGLFCLGFGAVLAVTNRLTEADIAAARPRTARHPSARSSPIASTTTTCWRTSSASPPSRAGR